MTRSLTILLIACLAVNLALTSPASPVKAASETTSASDLFDLDFPGGSLQEYVNAIRKKVRNANIIVMPEAMNIAMPPIQLTSVEVGSALATLDKLSIETDFQETEVSLNWRRGNQDEGELDIYTINARVHNYSFRTMVFSVNGILQGDVSERDLLSTIESSLELISVNQPEAKVQFHPETGIIIVRGYDSQVDLVKNLLDELNQAAARKQQLQTRSTATNNQQQRDEITRRRLEMIKQISARNSQLDKEINQLRDELNQCKTEIQTLELEVRTLKKDTDIE